METKTICCPTGKEKILLALIFLLYFVNDDVGQVLTKTVKSQNTPVLLDEQFCLVKIVQLSQCF